MKTVINLYRFTVGPNEFQECSWCAEPIYCGESAYYDDDAGLVFCCRRCAEKHFNHYENNHNVIVRG